METAETAETLTAPATLQVLTLFVRYPKYGMNGVVSSSYVLTGSASIESMVRTFDHYDGFDLVDFCVNEYALIPF